MNMSLYYLLQFNGRVYINGVREKKETAIRMVCERVDDPIQDRPPCKNIHILKHNRQIKQNPFEQPCTRTSFSVEA